MDLFRYENYRTYLKDFYESQKEKNRSYSYKVFANRAKLGSPNYLKLVIDGDRRITEKNLSGFIRGLGLKSNEAEYFTLLVHFQESTDPEQKNKIHAELVEKRVSNGRHSNVGGE